MNIKNQFLLDSKVTFLNHGSFGACPKEIFSEYQSWQKKLENQPVKFLDQYRDFGPNMTNVRKALSKNLNCNINNLVPVINATTGLNDFDINNGSNLSAWLAIGMGPDCLDRNTSFTAYGNGIRSPGV